MTHRWFPPCLMVLSLTHSVALSTEPPLLPHPLKFLSGDWAGKRGDGNPLRITYHLTSRDTALVETIMPEKEPSMTTLYYMDGRHLMLTHYCSIGNQPRMITDVPAGEIKRLAFGFLDATNLASPTDPHMHKMTLTVQDHDHLVQDWTLSQDGQETIHTFTLTRLK